MKLQTQIINACFVYRRFPKRLQKNVIKNNGKFIEFKHYGFSGEMLSKYLIEQDFFNFG